jgi:hypothetical protein
MNDESGRKLPTPTDDHDRKLLADVQDHGWHVVGVEADDEGPAFAYSIGLYHSFGHPEVIVLGLRVSVMHRMINGIGEQVRAGSKFGDLHESGEILEGYNVIFRNVERRHYREYFGGALWLYQHDRFPVVQCLWPDSHHRYSWHPLLSQTLLTRQPVLSDDKSWQFQAGKNRAVFTTKPVTQEGRPVLTVVHDEENDWQFLCGTTNQQEDGQLVSLGSMVERDPTIGELADLSAGWSASRRTAKSKWRREKLA